MPDINGIPYVESSDLVSAYPAASQALAQEVSDQLAAKLDYPAGGADGSLLVKSGTSAVWGKAGMTFIDGASSSAVSSISINNCFSTDFINYFITFDGLGSVSAGANLQLRLRASASDNSDAQYSYGGYRDQHSSSAGMWSASQTSAIVGYTASQRAQSAMWLYQPFSSVATGYSALSGGVGATGGAGIFVSGNHNVASSFDGFSLITFTGTITGTVRVYGIANA